MRTLFNIEDLAIVVGCPMASLFKINTRKFRWIVLAVVSVNGFSVKIEPCHQTQSR
jgi:hypothetical protein